MVYCLRPGTQMLEVMLALQQLVTIEFERNLTLCHPQVVMSCKASLVRHKKNEEFDSFGS